MGAAGGVALLFLPAAARNGARLNTAGHHNIGLWVSLTPWVLLGVATILGTAAEIEDRVFRRRMVLGGAAAMAFVGFYFAGWVTGGAAATMAQQKADKAVVAALAPICVDKFRHAQNADDNLGKLKAVSSSWDKGTYVSTGGWATMPGSVEPNTAVAQACAEMLSTAAK
jgi:hypothetical protein